MTAPAGTGGFPYSFAILRVVPHPVTGAYENVGVVLQSRPAEFVGLMAITDASRLRELAPDADVELLARYLRSCEAIARGEVDAGPIALLSPPERFYWLTAPRSDVLQSSRVRTGVTDDPAGRLRDLFEEHIAG